ncbi:MAG: lyase family protein [Bacteroidales bacterium]
MQREETDSIGTMQLPYDALYGIHTLRAHENFPASIPFHQAWYCAIGLTKLAVFQTYKQFKQGISQKYPNRNINLKLIEDDHLSALEQAATEVSEAKHFQHFLVPAFQGGAGTSINMNINEIITNRSLQLLGQSPGNYRIIDPIEHANIYQSTNDVIPTSLKVAAIKRLQQLETAINAMRQALEGQEAEHRNTLRNAYTQLQLATPSSYGRLFSSYNEALSRDWWRISKCFERIKTVNLGGGAAGTSLSIPRFMVMESVRTLQRLTGLPITRSENLHDTTANIDSLVEVHGMLKAHAVNLEKMGGDLRLLASDLVAQQEVTIPKRQTGSSIMPGKINPVIPEYLVGIAQQVYSNDTAIANLAARGHLDLNANLPFIGHWLLQSLDLLIAANTTCQQHLIMGLQVNVDKAQAHTYKNPSITTALIPFIGYNKAAELAQTMKEKKYDIFTANKQLQLLSDKELRKHLKPEHLLQQGFTINQLLHNNE